MTTDLTGKVALVTGASSGIGRATAMALARAGVNVVALARRTDKVEEVAERCRAFAPGSWGWTADVSSRDQCEEAVAAVQSRFGRLDVLVNNAGISLHRRADRTSVDDIERVMAVNFFGAVYTTMAALLGMVERREGHVVNVTSVAGYIPNPRESAYGASKAALSMWSHGLNVDLWGTGVHVGVLSPGPIDTEIWTLDQSEPDYRGKLHPPETVAAAALRMIRKGTDHMTVPRRFGAVGSVYPLVGRPMRWGLRRFAAETERRASRGGRGDRGAGGHA